MEKILTCIVCPMGCEITVDMDDNTSEIKSITGNTCPRGEKYARNEMTNPMRQLTSTVVIEGGIYDRLPIILSGDIPKDKMLDVMQELSKVRVKAPVKRNDILIENVCSLGVNVIASRSMEAV